MKLRLSRLSEQRPLLAKLVIGVSALVALATAALPDWIAQQQDELHLVFDERNERTAILRIELSGKLYAAARGATLELTTTADRAATDLRLSARPLSSDEALPEPLQAAREADVAPEPQAFHDGGNPDLSSPTMTWLSVPLECAQDDPPARRPKSCVELFEITLTRRSQEPLAVDLIATVYVGGGPGATAPGKPQVLLEESAP